MQLKQYKYYIGIDCGVQTGICVWSKEDKKIRHIATVKIHEAMEGVKFWHQSNPGQVFVRVEDARKVIFKTDLVKAQGAGSVKRDAIIWEDYLEWLKIDFEMVRPKKQITKLSAAAFKQITKYDGSTSSHARDAGMLVYGF